MNEDFYIIWKESFQKALNNATRNWQTTYAVLKLPEVIEAVKHIGEDSRERVVEVTMDLSESMRKIVEICFPRATRVIVRFHVQKLALEAVQEIRIKRRWSGEGRLRLFPNACRDHL